MFIMRTLIKPGILLCLLGYAVMAAGGPNPGYDPLDFTVYAFSQSNVHQEDPQVYRLQPDVVIRAIGKWSTMGDQKTDYNFGQIDRYRGQGIAFIGGGTASVIFRQDFASAEAFDGISTRDAGNLPVPHDYIAPGARRGSLFNPAFRKYLVDYCKLQIDGGVDGLFLDEAIAGFDGGEANGWNGNEGFDDHALADFNRYLIEKYPAFTAADWKSRFRMTDDNLVRRDIPPDDLVNNFNYRRYLQAHGWNGRGAAKSPLNPANPLADEWGVVTNNRMYAGDDSFTATYLRRYWKEMVDELREHARTARRNVIITSNGLFPDVDFNSVGMYPYNRDGREPGPRGADYVPVIKGRLNGAKSLLDDFRYLKDMSRRISGDVPVVVFIDWPTAMMTDYLAMPVSDKQDYWRIFGAEAYAAGIFPAFHLKDTVGSPTATEQGMLDFFIEHTRFYKQHRRLFRNSVQSAGAVDVSAKNIAASLLTPGGGSLKALHLINHNYKRGILPQPEFKVEVELESAPRRITMVSPDFTGEKTPPHSFKDGKLTVNVDGIRYYNIVVIEQEKISRGERRERREIKESNHREHRSLRIKNHSVKKRMFDKYSHLLFWN